MCLAVAAKIISISDDQAMVEVKGSRIAADLSLTPDAKEGDYVLVHAGFAIGLISEKDYRIQQQIDRELNDYAGN